MAVCCRYCGGSGKVECHYCAGGIGFSDGCCPACSGSGYHTCLRVADQELWKRRIQRNKIRNHLTDE